MGSKGKIFIAAISVLVVANYSKVVESTFGTVKRSVGTVELARIDKALWQYHTMEEIGSSGADRYYFPKDQEQFEKVLQESFDTPGRDATEDQWGMKFQYRPSADERGYALLSFGPDREGATEDDLWLERRERNVTMSCGLDRIESDATAQMDAVTQAKKELTDELQKAAEEAEDEEAGESAETETSSAETTSASGSGETHWSDEVETAAEGAAAKVEATVSAVAEKAQSLMDPDEPPASEDPPAEPEDTTAQPAAAPQPAPPPVEPAAVKAASAVPSAPPQPPAPKPPRLRKLSPRQDRQARRLLVSAKNLAINNRDSKAKRYYERLLHDFPGTSYAQQAEEALAELAK